MSPLSDDSYNEGFQGDYLDENYGKGHTVLIYVYNKLKCAGYLKKGEIINNDI